MKKLSLLLAVFFVSMLVLGPLYIFREYTSKGETKFVAERLHWNTGNTTRVWGADWPEQQRNIFNMLTWQEPQKLLLLPADDWRPAVQLSHLMAPPLKALPVLMTDKAAADAGALPVYLEQLGLARDDIAAVVLPVKWSQYAAAIKESLAVDVHIAKDQPPGRNTLVVPGDDPAWAIPALTWSALTGDRVVAAAEGDETTTLPDGSNNIYLLGNKNLLMDKGSQKKARLVGGNNPVEAAVAFAEYYQRDTDFGWWNSRETPEGGRTYFLVDEKNWRGALTIASLAPRGRFGPMLLTKGTRLPPKVESYYWRTKPEWFVTPTEGPYNHTFVVGDLKKIPFAAQARADFAEEINTYMMQGDQGNSALDGWVIIWLAFIFSAAIWIWNHMVTRNTDLSPYMKFSWLFVALLLGPLGIYAYYINYRGYSHRVSQARHIKPFWVQVISANLSTLGFGAPAMIIVGFILTINGLPLIEFDSPFYLLGNPMIISIIISYLAGLAVLVLVFVPLMLRINEDSRYWDTVKDSALVIFISMSGVSLGMLPLMWWLMMEYLPMMPEESNLLWWGVMYSSTIVGAFTGLLFNWPLVAHGRKKGDM
ncbi:DUF4396 domain-containing protein [Metallumcola ferriviriculae]|uniref:DUF4396 domain-containing protein n=1 Tax=Metallumcola ferriviriculae TaxID=3039180 RepID=A0AAU0UPR8_9FIRM|nr:DUF4396 domain-containing protein [Desulfitibacteraceae bacterium MK1]